LLGLFRRCALWNLEAGNPAIRHLKSCDWHKTTFITRNPRILL